MTARILVDCSLIDFSRQPTGIPRVVMKYLQEGYRWGLSHDCVIVPVLPQESGLSIVRPLPTWLTNEHRLQLLPYVGENGPPTKSWFGASRPAEASGPRIEVTADDILFCPAYWHDIDPDFYWRARNEGAYVCTLVHDLLPVIFSNCYNAPWRFHFKDHAIAAIAYSHKILTVSRYTMHAVTELAARTRKDLPPCEVAYNGFEPLTAMGLTSTSSYLGDRRLARALEGRPPPLVMVGSIEPKKAHMPVIETLEQMWEAGYKRDLFIIGRRGWLDQPIVDRIENCPFYDSRLFWFDALDDSDLALCYARAHALVFASLGEGFGIPMIEAAYYRAPVVVYDTEIAREIIGGYGLFFSTSLGLVDRLLELEDPTGHAAVRTRLADFTWPTWADIVPATFDKLLADARAVRPSGKRGLG